MNAVPPTETLTVTAPPPAAKSHLWAGSEFGFTDFLAAINPLQHIPIVGTIYRAITGDTIGNVARVVGDGIYGGPIGLASGVIDVASTEVTGKDIGQHVIATLEDIGSIFGPSTPAKPAAPAPEAPSALVAAAQAKDPPKLPLLGSATTAGELAAAAPISPLLAPKLAAQAQAQAASPAPGAIRPLAGPGQGIPIDVSAHGIAMMRATSAVHNPAPVALNLPAGAFSSAMAGSGGSAKPAIDTQPDFADRMRDGLAKYDALMAARNRDATPGSVDQVH
jgi:hypothetical protein